MNVQLLVLWYVYYNIGGFLPSIPNPYRQTNQISQWMICNRYIKNVLSQAVRQVLDAVWLEGENFFS